mgnify:CR=1 FL=1
MVVTCDGWNIRNNADIPLTTALAEAKQISPFNVAYLFLRVYAFIFRRISHGAGRFQEVQADRVAARLYGPEAIRSGLLHVLRRQVSLQRAAEEIGGLPAGAPRRVSDLYVVRPEWATEIENRLQAIVNAPTTEDDSHPSPADRFAFLEGITSDAPPVGEATAWELFVDREGTQREMIALLESEGE